MTKRNFLAGKTYWLTLEQSEKVGFTKTIKVTFKDSYVHGVSGIEYKVDGEWYNDFTYEYWLEVLGETRNSIKSNKKGNIMTKLSAIMKTVLDKDLRAMQKLGYLDGSLEVTESGLQWLAAQYVKLNKAELGKVAQEELKDRKKSKKCKDSDSCEDEE